MDETGHVGLDGGHGGVAAGMRESTTYAHHTRARHGTARVSKEAHAMAFFFFFFRAIGSCIYRYPS